MAETHYVRLEQSDPSFFRYVLGFLIVGIAWGFTTPFMRQAAIVETSSGSPEKEDQRTNWAMRKARSIWTSVSRLVKNPSYTVPLLVNLSGSVWFFLIVGQAELSLTVPITNSLAFVFTVLGEWVAEGKTVSKQSLIGMLLVLSGIGLCVHSKT